MQLFSALRHRPFALLWSGQTISRLGDSLYRIALVWWVLEQTGSAAQMGWVTFFSLTPTILFLLIGGVAVDRFPRRAIMLLSDVLSGLVVAGVAVLAYAQQLEVWHIYLASLLFGFVEAFFFPAYAAIVPEIAPAHALPSANALTDLSRQLMGMAGPALGATLVAVGGTPFAFAIDATTFFASALCLALMGRTPTHRPVSQAPTPPPQPPLADLREGFQLVFQSPWLWMTIALFGLINVTANGPFSVVLPLFIKNNLHLDVAAFGFAQSIFSITSVLTAMWLGRFTRLRWRGRTAYLATALTGLAGLMVGLSSHILGVWVASALRGVGIMIFSLIWTNTLQELVPRDKLGRVASIDALGSFLFIPLGYIFAGWAADQIGAPRVFLYGGVATVILCLLALIHPAIRNLD